MKREATRDLLIEIGTEELPASAQRPLAEALARNLETLLSAQGLKIPRNPTAFWGPRRLAVLAANVPHIGADRESERRGPSLKTAFDAEGKPTQAAEGFARSVGVPVDRLDKLRLPEGEWLAYRHTEKGRTLAEALEELLPTACSLLPLPRRMRWGEGEDFFLRPVRWLLVRFGGDIVPVSAFGMQAGGKSFGHRVHHPGEVTIRAPKDYCDALRKAHVLADPGERLVAVQSMVERAASDGCGIAAPPSDALYAEIAGMVEWPEAVVGNFDARFLDLGEPVVVTTLAHHQRFVPIRNPQGALTNRFVAVVNLESRNVDAVRHGLERVVRPRLEDAAFYYRRDRERPLAAYTEDLTDLVFGERLGSMADKAGRLKRLAAGIATEIGADVEAAARAGELAKCDLATGMVFEFPELQGVMGGVYAAEDGENEAVAKAIAEQYFPTGADDELPCTPCGVALALADRLDTLIGGFAAGHEPTGTKDPFGLRRAAFGLLRVAGAGAPTLDLGPWLKKAAAIYPGELKAGEALPAIEAFLRERLRSMLLERNHAPDLIQAVLAVSPLVPAEVLARAEALARFRERPEAEALAAANKRIANILRQAGEIDQAHSAADGEGPPAETALAQSLSERLPALKTAMEKRDFDAALTGLAALRAPVDRFFDEVLVMDSDPAVRARRLKLLARLHAAFLEIADIGELQGIERK